MNQRQDDDFPDDFSILEQAGSGGEAAGFSDRIVPKPVTISLFLTNLEERKYQLSLIELNGIQVAEVCQIFERVNTGGRPLSIFDIVVAKTYRPRDNAEKKAAFYLRELFDDFRADPRMASSEYRHLSDHDYLQLLAVIVKLHVPGSGINNITDRYLSELRAEHIEQVWAEAAEAFRVRFRFLDRTLNLHGPGLIPYRYFYMVLVGYFFRRKNPDYALLKRYFWATALDQRDLLTGTSNIWPEIDLLNVGGANACSDMVIDRAAFRTSSYNSKSRMYRAILGFFASQQPCNWDSPHNEVLASLYYQVTDRPNLHHIFPRAFVETADGEIALEGAETINSLMNIAYITQLTNLQISARNPVDYLKDFASQPEFPDVLEGHLIPRTILDLAGKETMPIDALKTFIEDRIDQLVNELKSLGLKVTESDSHTPPGRIVETQAVEG